MKLEDINYTIQQHKILEHVSLEVKKGEVTVLLGPSGAGKSTLLRTINLLTVPDSGKITLDNREIDTTKISKREIAYLRKNVSMVFQHYPLFVNKTVLENIAECLRIVHGYSRKESREIAIESLEQVRLGDKINEYPQHLSGGQKQRVSIARALSIHPKVILLDEPTSALDHELVDEVLCTIRSLAEKSVTMMIVTHDLNFARSIANQVIFLKQGTIASQGGVSEMFDYAQL